MSDLKEEERFWVIVIGNPIDGISIYGPFGLDSSAIDFADKYLVGVDWWVTELKDTSSLV